MNKIIFEHASFTYPNGFVANDDLNLVIEQGERLRS